MADNNKLPEDDRPLTDAEIKKYQKALDVALKKSNDSIKDFKLYVGVYGSNRKFQTSRLTKDEYEMMQDPLQSHNVKSLAEFYANLGEGEENITKKAIVLTSENFAMAFHPMIWPILTYEERFCAMRIAFKHFTGREVNDFCNHLTTTVVFVGDEYKGALNIGATAVYGGVDGSLKLLHQIANADNSLKFNYYFNKRQAKDYEYITDFETFEELQYVSPLEANEAILDEVSDETKALCINSLYERTERQNYMNADYLVLEHSAELVGMHAPFEKIVQDEIKQIQMANKLIADNLGYSQRDIDERYLEIKLNIFNHFAVTDHNRLVEEYQELDKKIEKIKEPVLASTKELREKRAEKQKELEKATDRIEEILLNDEIDELTKKINQIYERRYKKEVKVINELSKKRDKLYDQIQEINSHILTLEDAKKHFKEHFEKTKKYTSVSEIIPSKSNTKMTEIPEEEKLELN